MSFVKPQPKPRMGISCQGKQLPELGVGIFIPTFPSFIVSTSQEGERDWRLNQSQMTKDLMNHDLWWSLPRYLNIAGYLQVIQENWNQPREQHRYIHHGSLDPCSCLPRGPRPCFSPPRGHAPHCSHKDPVKTPVVSRCSRDQFFSGFPALSESNFYPYKVLEGSSWPAPMASLLHPLPLPSPHPLSFSHPGLGCCSNTPGSFLAASA